MCNESLEHLHTMCMRQMQLQAASVRDTACSNFVNNIKAKESEVATKRPVMQGNRKKQKCLKVSTVITLLLDHKVEGA